MAWKPDYIDEEDLKSYLRIPTSDTEDDAEIALAISAASRAVDKHTHRQFGKTDSPESRLYTAYWDRRINRWVIEIDDLQDDSGLEINADLDEDDTYDDVIDEYFLEPINNKEKGKPFERIVVKSDSEHKPNKDRNRVEVKVDTWGWTSVPDPVKQATLIQSSRFMARREAPFGIAGSPETGSEMRLLEKLDPDVAVSLKDFIRWWAAV